jgi:hypothetical protein
LLKVEMGPVVNVHSAEPVVAWAKRTPVEFIYF